MDLKKKGRTMTTPFDVLLLREVVGPNEHKLSFIKDIYNDSFHTAIVSLHNESYVDDAAKISIGVAYGSLRIVVHGQSPTHKVSRTEHWDFSLDNPDCIKKARDKLLEILTSDDPSH